MPTRWARYRRAALDAVFPRFCAACGAEGQWLCENCRRQIICRPVLYCPVCGCEGDGAVCGPCRPRSYLDGAAALFAYEEKGTIGELIKLFKYHYARELTEIWRDFLSASAPVWRRAFDKSAVITPVPLHPRRQRERGFNQALLLAKIVSELTGAPLDLNLRRCRYTRQQARLSKTERRENLADAFVYFGPSAPARVVLIDDVFTTGVTMQEAARALRQAGARTVWGLALARG